MKWLETWHGEIDWPSITKNMGNRSKIILLTYNGTYYHIRRGILTFSCRTHCRKSIIFRPAIDIDGTIKKV